MWYAFINTWRQETSFPHNDAFARPLYSNHNRKKHLETFSAEISSTIIHNQRSKSFSYRVIHWNCFYFP